MESMESRDQKSERGLQDHEARETSIEKTLSVPNSVNGMEEVA